MFGPPLAQGNRTHALVDGAAFFPDMLAAIRAAERTVTFESYIRWSGKTGAQFTEALVERAKAGVRR
jgi:cardiolipin synthase